VDENMKIRIWMLMPCILFVFSISWAETYKWVDEKGTVHFTQDSNSIPERFRDQAETRNDKSEDSEKKVNEKYKKDLKGSSKEKGKEQRKRLKEEKEPINTRKIESEVTDAFEAIISLWKEGKYEALYECGTLSSKANVAKENFVSRMAKKTWVLASSWETLRDIKVEIRHSKLAYASARIGYKPKRGGDTKIRNETYQLKLENGIWRVDLSKILKAVK
jgi:hypothetical protein